MVQASLVIRDAPAVQPGAKRYRIDCAHGSTWAVILPGRSSLGEVVGLQMLTMRHDRQNGCRCSHELRPQYAGTARA